jgi:phage gpG-like protein
MDNSQITIPIKDLQGRFKQVLLRLPAMAGNEVVNFALDNFNRQGFLGDSFQPWRLRKNPTKWGKAPKRNGRAILVDTGQLRRSIRVIRTTGDEVVVGTDVPYARAHNEGLRLDEIQQVKEHQRKVNTIATLKGKKAAARMITVKAHTRRINQDIPRRQFLGNSQYLNNRLNRMAAAELLKALR